MLGVPVNYAANTREREGVGQGFGLKGTEALQSLLAICLFAVVLLAPRSPPYALGMRMHV